MLRLRRSDKIELLRQVPLFRELSQRHLDQIAKCAEEVSFGSGTVLMRQREHGREMYLVVDGSVRIELDGTLLAHLGNGDFVGEMSLLDGQPRSATVVTETPTTCLVVDGRSFDHLVDSVPGLGRMMLAVLCRRLRDMHEHFVIPAIDADKHAAGDGVQQGASGPVVDGVLCVRNHFNNPAAAYCVVCGVSMLQRSRKRVRGPRPPLGMLIADDGSLYVLDGDYVIGDSPEEDERVVSGEAKPLALLNGSRGVGRQAEILLQGWSVWLRGHGRGVMLSTPDATGPRALDAGETVELAVGSTITLGGRTLRYESNLLHVW